MRRHFLWITVLILLGLNACATYPVPRSPANRLPIAAAIDTSKACATWRWIGIKSHPDAKCPKVPGWSVSPLFGRKDPSQQRLLEQCYAKNIQVPDPEVIQELNRFCVYEIADPAKTWRDLPFPPAVSPELVRFDQDCAALSSSGMDLEAKTWKPLFEHFLSQAGHLETPPGIGKQPGVRLAFLDTEPTRTRVPNEDDPRRSQHGYTLAHFARHLVCDSKTQKGCAARITTQLALPIVRFDPDSLTITESDEEQGGFVGTWSDLAEAIDSEVFSWRQGPEKHLVLNLSVAWDGKLFGGLSEERIAGMRAGTQAVYRALQYAEGYGALVLAAAGNQRYGPNPGSGPLLPAAWERGGKEESCSEPPSRPLLYAVGGVQTDGFPLANARRDGLPRRVAYADHAVVASFDPDKRTTMYTGSSVATAVASSIAAVVWNAHPDLDAHQVMEILDKSGDVLDGSGDVPRVTADFWFGAEETPSAVSRPLVHRLSLCSALAEAACAPTDASCRARFNCYPWRQERPILSSIIMDAGADVDPATSELRSIPLPCKAERLFYKGTSPQPPLCPSDQFAGITSQPWLFPQPEDNPCPNCVVIPPPRQFAALGTSLELSAPSTSYTLMGVVPKDWDGCLVGATLDVDRPDDSGRQRISVVFPSPVCAGSEIDQAIDIGLPLERNTTAILSFMVNKNGREYSVQSPVLLAE
ncbi:MAG TPA: S8/S53 family peptidase [Thermoanaerobaculia bacterium]|jgi:hypothetical protein